MTEQVANEATPDSLMAHFKGRGLKSIVVFTIVVHVVVIVGSSLPFLVRSAFGADSSKLSEEERVKSAVEDATAALRKIAKKHGLNPQDISSQFAGGSRKPAATGGADATTGPAEPGEDADPEAPPERVKSAYETNLESKAEGPTVPAFEEEDIF